MGINDVRRVCPQRNANSNANATAPRSASANVSNPLERSSRARARGDTHARTSVYNQPDCTVGGAQI